LNVEPVQPTRRQLGHHALESKISKSADPIQFLRMLKRMCYDRDVLVTQSLIYDLLPFVG
jgi:hypothetical protein